MISISDYSLLIITLCSFTRYPFKILRYCLDNAQRGCAVVSITKLARAQPYLDFKKAEGSSVF